MKTVERIGFTKISTDLSGLTSRSEMLKLTEAALSPKPFQLSDFEAVSGWT